VIGEIWGRTGGALFLRPKPQTLPRRLKPAAHSLTQSVCFTTRTLHTLIGFVYFFRTLAHILQPWEAVGCRENRPFFFRTRNVSVRRFFVAEKFPSFPIDAQQPNAVQIVICDIFSHSHLLHLSMQAPCTLSKLWHSVPFLWLFLLMQMVRN
jgi:hypothetical protein